MSEVLVVVAGVGVLEEEVVAGGEAETITEGLELGRERSKGYSGGGGLLEEGGSGGAWGIGIEAGGLIEATRLFK